MSTDTQIPKLRTDMEIFATSYQGQRALVVKDALGLIKNPVVLHGRILDFVGLIDGKRTPRDIQLEVIRQQEGVFVGVDYVQSLLSELDSLFLLDSDYYKETKNKIFKEYTQLSVRPAVLAGQAYPNSREGLDKYLSSFFAGILSSAPQSHKKVSALIAPHIDLRVGKKAYAQAYSAVKGVSPKTVVLLGTGHSLHHSYFSLTEKDFETPLGLVKTDKLRVQKLKAVDAKVVAPHDLDHRHEHSIEFQLIFLQHLFGSDFTLVPVLCGSLNRDLAAYSRPSEIPGVGGILKEMKKILEGRAPDVLVVAGVDFSHIGPKFGHSYRASSLMSETKDFDARLIDAICQGDPGGFWKEIKKVDNRYNVCGFSSIAFLLELFPGAVGQRLGYDIWEEEETQSAVSFASIALTA
ncbi:MAG: AmmeMemoRadiSam system protein B [Candidatus Aminicenantes bacterium]|jgi:AmmeMemoRadiSam system protein B